MTGDPDICQTCGKGRLVDGVVSLPYECCAVYFYGFGSWSHNQWLEMSAYQQGRRTPRAPTEER